MNGLLERSKLFLILFLLLVIVGVYTFITVSQREIPETTLNIGTITTIYPGATVDAVERHVTNPIEADLLAIDGIEEVSSVSAAGVSSIVITVEERVDKSEVMGEVRQSVANVSVTFPDEVQSPTISDVQSNMPISSYFVTADDPEQLQTLYSEIKRWEEAVSRVAGVADVIVKGIEEEQIILTLDSEELGANGFAFPDVINALENEFDLPPLGKQEVEGSLYQLKIDEAREIAALERIWIGENFAGDAVFIEDVGSVTVEAKQPNDRISIDGTSAISFTVVVQPGEDIPTVHNRVDGKVQQLSTSLSDEFELVSYYSQADLVNEIFRGLFMSLAIAVVAVVVTSSLGLTLSGAVVVALAVPLSVLMGIIPLPFVGVDLNQISVIGLIIALGILVDDSIVVNDNIQRRYALGDSAKLGIINGVKEIWVSIVTSTLAIVFTFSPLVFLSGANGDFIRAMPTILITTILASTVVALIFVPILRFLLFRVEKRNRRKRSAGLLGTLFERLQDFYADTLLKNVGEKPVAVSVVGLLATTAIFGLVLLTPFEFFPAADREEVTVTVTLPAGTTLDETYERLEEMALYFEEDEGVYETSIFAGSGLPNLFNSSLDQSGEYTGQLVVRVDRENQNAQGLIEQWTEPVREQFPEATIFLETIEQGPPSGAPVTVTLTGSSMEKLIDIRNDLTEEIQALGAELVVDDVGESEPTIVYSVDREQMEERNIRLRDITQRIGLVTDGVPVRAFDDGNETMDIVMFVDRIERGNELQLDELELAGTSQGEQGPPELMALSDLVTADYTEELRAIPHLNGERAITIRAFPGTATDFEAKVANIVETYQMQLGDSQYDIVLGGENENQDNFFAEITVLFIIVLVLVYLLVAFQFNSLTRPFLILVAVYLAIAGAILGLFVTQTPISFLAVMGMVSLTGIVVRNAIVLIEFIEQRLCTEMNLLDAVREAGRARIRPILLTAITSIVALMPIALSGDALFTPLAITIISGILFSTLLTLLIVPALYVAMVRRKYS
ncbi:efflux RND transporter permease subunit [Alkalihalobacillus hemicellulosilyticus]|uniref:Cobalt-zinc-cadmium resistance protein CzcA n=1 Tax=Halalkalibacter hemicellulosilyticusJCM 9152 TaxID=1236971 RepID=W4QDY2_9BACI|nr:efflux RND transporter permease subunit [Halalkalibacter hemicellulosilyticus]GAE30265.1 cobalt-zinc-cadmium resistance protein CzcA [Halalkalibacter hemicellulosilyticusJCM 9152]